MKIEGTGRTDRSTMEPKWAHLRKPKETAWITTLGTAYPCNLNEKTDDIKSTNNDIIGLNFPSLHECMALYPF